MPNSSPYSTLILIALMVAAFYFLILRPNKKRQQAQQQTMNQLTPGTRVLLTSGIFGTIVEIGAKQAVLETAPGVQLTVLKPAIARVVRDGDEDVLEDDEDDELEPLEDLDASASGAVSADGSAPSPYHPVHHDTLDEQRHGATESSLLRPHVEHDPRSGTSTTPLKD